MIDFVLGTVLLKRGRWDAAHDAFASAFKGLYDKTPQARLLAVHYRNAVIYTHRRGT